jgi:hypothetical protein
MKTIAAVAVMMMMPALAFAQINKCVDKSGKVVGYGNECPAGTRSEASGVKSAPAPAPAAAKDAGKADAKGDAKGAGASQPKSLAERDADFRKRQVEKQEAEAKAQKTAADSEQKQRACTDAQSYLKSLQSGSRIVRSDAKTGERSYLADSDYPKEIARTQQQIQQACK